MTKRSEYIKGEQFLFPAKVHDLKEVATGKYLMSFDKQFTLKAGHVVAVAIDRTHEPRIYSVCSGENDDKIQILFDLKEDGLLTPKLAALLPGKQIYVSKPYGSFMPTTKQPMWWIATGTGVAPFYAMLRSGFKAEKLLHGARGADFFYFESAFKETLQENYIRCNSTHDGEGDYLGRVSGWLDHYNELPTNHIYYLCGRALMVVEVRDLLISKGIPYENIFSEIFF